MKIRRLAVLTGSVLSIALAGLGPCLAALSVSDADKAFVAKVSQGGMYEVELGKLAERKGAAQDIRDQGNTETHDHTLVGDKLKQIAQGASLDFPSSLNAEFQERLAAIGKLDGEAFDTAYVADMKKIHAADGAAFQEEAKNGTNPALKAFAAETYRIVQRHIGELGAPVK